jgi:hypothetical protein
MTLGRFIRAAAAWVAATTLVAAASFPLRAQTPAPARPAAAGVAIGSFAWVDRTVERAELPAKSTWRKVAVGDRLRTGDTYRTAEDATARLDFPWMQVALAPSSMLTIPASTVLSTVLEQGRAEFSGEGRDIVKITVGEGEVRGGGHLVLRRSSGHTSAAALKGAFRVRAAGRVVAIQAGQGTVVIDGRPPEPASPLPVPPTGLVPGQDPVYVVSGRPVELQWAPSGSSYSVQILAFQQDELLLARDVGAPPLRIQIPWLGTYRWRVAARDPRGLEGPPSTTGYICSVER